MKTRILKPTKQAITTAAEILAKGGLAIYPTESAYALGCDATSSKAAEKIFKLKGRAAKKPLPMIIGDLKTAEKYGTLNQYAWTLLLRYSPGPLTLIVPKKPHKIPNIVNTHFVFRIPSSRLARELASSLGKPVVSTSANPSGTGAVYSIKRVIELFDGKVDVILDGGDLEKRPVSTIFDVRSGKVVREGAISKADVEKALKK